ncbi:hypothetical protein HDF24_11720 [Mucilaginibacter sp. X4EP1]|uniref:hypothetical protein n=1 Tax=Mucilaginibacter sp. X4EP1 TaxID=2723092 RepID=UPI0021692989|nr:hypothetical protein [Mucilaginibacter sp. X4EP1]MCS3812926.1 hypothetical protein [Mucilaginibacter sp. X4EP1]
MKIKAATFVLLICILFGCKKGDNIVLNGTFTDCPPGGSCSYFYHENVDYTNLYALTSGQERVFIYKCVTNDHCTSTQSFYFKTSMGNSSFEIDSVQVLAAKVATVGLVCPCCDVPANLKQVHGDIRGKKTGNNTWLINAYLVQNDASGQPVDTVVVNQYFTLAPNGTL